MKKCNKCSRILDESNFRKHQGGSDCNDCEKIYMKAYRERTKDKARAYKKVYCQINKDRLALENAEYYQSNKEKMLQKHREWKHNNKERMLELSRIGYQRRRSLKKQLESNFDKYDWQRCKDSFNNRCAYCGKDSKLTQEHFIALKHGGEFTRNNILPICGSCNYSKQSQNFFVWYPQQPFYSKRREKSILKYLQYDPQTLGQQLRLVI